MAACGWPSITTRFNPCFGGLVGNVLAVVPLPGSSSCFNPCFGGLVGQVLERARMRQLVPEFQSLFWWIGRSGPSTCGGSSSCFASFNPCFGGLVGQVLRRGEVRPGSEEVSILVLVDWSVRYGRAGRVSHIHRVSILVLVDWSVRLGFSPSAGRLRRCFNPCFGGLVGQVTRSNAELPTVAKFQSLFWWIGRSGNSMNRDCLGDWMFQSLFWWIGRSGAAQVHRQQGAPLVSILVLVDWSVRL